MVLEIQKKMILHFTEIHN